MAPPCFIVPQIHKWLFWCLCVNRIISVYAAFIFYFMYHFLCIVHHFKCIYKAASFLSKNLDKKKKIPNKMISNVLSHKKRFGLFWVSCYFKQNRHKSDVILKANPARAHIQNQPAIIDRPLQKGKGHVVCTFCECILFSFHLYRQRC